MLQILNATGHPSSEGRIRGVRAGSRYPLGMTAKEKLLKEAPKWSEHEAEIALRAVEREHADPDERSSDEWGNVDEFSAQSSAATLRRLDEEETKAGFSWDNERGS